MDLSLDDIIKKNTGRRVPANARGRSQNTSVNRRNNTGRVNKPPMRNTGRTNKPQQRTTQGGDKTRGSMPNKNGVADARLKIIQKFRGRLNDARDKLSEIAKQTDARSRIQGRRNPPGPPKMNGRRDLVRDQRGIRGRSGGMNPKPGAILQRSIKNNLARPQRQPNFAQRQPNFAQRPFRNNFADIRDDSLIRCTINRPMNDYNYDVPVPHEDMEYNLPLRPHELSSIKVVTQNEYLNYNQEYVPEPMCLEIDSSPPPLPVFRQREPPRSLPQARVGPVRMSQEMRARLDSPNPNRPLYIPEGYRIVVSNLHATVTHEDIKELFEDIGPLLTSRLVRAGTAEVIYKQQKDAKKAVEAYHNRQLDGQPMKCMLVNSRGTTPSSGVLRSSNLPPPPKFPNSSKSMVVPDLSAIHKALFTSK